MNDVDLAGTTTCSTAPSRGLLGAVLHEEYTGIHVCTASSVELAVHTCRQGIAAPSSSTAVLLLGAAENDVGESY